MRGLNSPWLSSHVFKLIHTRDFQLRKARRSGLDEDWSKCRKCRNQVTTAIRAAKAAFNSNPIQDNLNNPRNFWRSIKKILPSKSVKSETVNQIKTKGQVLTDKRDISNAFCKFFSSVKSRISETIVRQLPVLRPPSRYTSQVFHLSPVSNGFMCKELKQLKTAKATGLDGVPARLLKDGALNISAPLTHIVNLSISTQRVPQDWKHAKVLPLNRLN